MSDDIETACCTCVRRLGYVRGKMEVALIQMNIKQLPIEVTSGLATTTCRDCGAQFYVGTVIELRDALNRAGL